MTAVGDLIARPDPRDRTEDASGASFDRFMRVDDACFKIVGLRNLSIAQRRYDVADWLNEVADELFDMVRDARYAWRDLRSAA